MSLINGDKSRAGRQRKTRFEKRERNRLLRQSLTAQPVQPAAPASPVVAPSVIAPIIAASVVAAAIPAVVAKIAAKKPIVQYPKRKSL